MLEIAIFIIIFLILVGAGFWFQSGERAEIEGRRLAQDWPTTTGTVTAASVEETRGFTMRIRGQPFRRRIKQYKPSISYSYQVAGLPYQSSRYKNGYISQGSEWTTFLPQKAQQVAGRYETGQRVQVTYSPQAPSLSYLVINASTSRQVLNRVIGFLLYTAAAVLVILYARALSQDYLTRRAAGENPAIITATASQIKYSLGHDLGLGCSFDEKPVRGAYQSWDCESPGSMVSIYVRQDAPEKVDRISMSTAAQKAPELFAAVVRYGLPQFDPEQVRDWVSQTAPSLTENNNEMETTINDVLFSLSLGWNDTLSLAIGELQDF